MFSGITIEQGNQRLTYGAPTYKLVIGYIENNAEALHLFEICD